jgi:hypothetical protein
LCLQPLEHTKAVDNRHFQIDQDKTWFLFSSALRVFQVLERFLPSLQALETPSEGAFVKRSPKEKDFVFAIVDVQDNWHYTNVIRSPNCANF